MGLSDYGYGTITLYGLTFQEDSPFPIRPDTGPHSTSPLSFPQRIRFDLFRFRSPLLTESHIAFFSCAYYDASLQHVPIPGSEELRELLDMTRVMMSH